MGNCMVRGYDSWSCDDATDGGQRVCWCGWWLIINRKLYRGRPKIYLLACYAYRKLPYRRPTVRRTLNSIVGWVTWWELRLWSVWTFKFVTSALHSAHSLAKLSLSTVLSRLLFVILWCCCRLAYLLYMHCRCRSQQNQIGS